ncbi:MAG: hypoxanthine phosphoribosyltransferase [Candidatus Tectomicrobia bacterium]|nr:hypoxanthine phosphoribosyltransferase [Candidatus Tectomicrobia bacterium]
MSKGEQLSAPGEILISSEAIRRRVRELGEAISHDYAGLDLRLVSVLKGAVVFVADLLRAISIPVSLDFIATASYGNKTNSSGAVKILKDLDEKIEGVHVLIVEDIIDTGLTLEYLLKTLAPRNPESLKVCALLDKPARRVVDLPIAYCGFEIPDRFVVGYGLDYNQLYRNLPFICALEEEGGREEEGERLSH